MPSRNISEVARLRIFWPKLQRHNINTPISPKTHFAEHADCLSKLIYNSLQVWMVSPSGSSKSGPRCGASCLGDMFSARPNISNTLVERNPTGSFSHGPESSKFLSMGRKDSWTSCMNATFPWRSKTLPGRKSRVWLQRPTLRPNTQERLRRKS